MKFIPTPLSGSYTIELQKQGDERGFFARFFCVNEYEQHDLDKNIVQINNSLSKDAGTLRGIHYQLPPKSETKVVRCLKGSLFDVIVDLRPDSPTFLKWYGTTLSAENRTMIYVPKRFGHAIITLEDNTEALYLATEFYAPEYERGLLWNDPRIGIQWPIEPVVLSEKDKRHPPFSLRHHCGI